MSSYYFCTGRRNDPSDDPINVVQKTTNNQRHVSLFYVEISDVNNPLKKPISQKIHKIPLVFLLRHETNAGGVTLSSSLYPNKLQISLVNW